MTFKRHEIVSDNVQDKYIFEPKEDITSYELAQLIPILTHAFKEITPYEALEAKRIIPRLNRWIEELPDSQRRHFKLIEP